MHLASVIEFVGRILALFDAYLKYNYDMVCGIPGAN